MSAMQKRNVKIEQVLHYEVGPQLIVISANEKTKILAVALPHNESNYVFFGAFISHKQFENFLDNRADIRHVLRNPDRSKWCYLSAGRSAKALTCNLADFPDFPSDWLVPDHGIFASDLTEEYHLYKKPVVQVQRFSVDGNWDMREFSKFHAQISDLYAAFKSIEILQDNNVLDKAKRAIVEAAIRPWKGGGSYLGFFRSLSNVGGRDYRPGIKAIQWASPGHIDVTGSESSLKDVIHSVSHYAAHQRKIMDSYNQLYNYLSAMKLLRISLKDFDGNSVIAHNIENFAKELAKEVNLASYDSIKALGGGNRLVTAKILLSLTRRVTRLHSFFSEGRVSA
jgi:hypothetical protein